MGDLTSALTDLVLGLVAGWCWWRCRGRLDLPACWSHFFGWVAAGALGGTVFHFFLEAGDRGADVAWSGIAVMLALSLGYLASATLQETTSTVSRRALRVFPALGVVGFFVLWAAGLGGPPGVAIASVPAMVAAVALWVRAAFAGHPKARLVLAAMVASALAAIARVVAVQADVAWLHPDGVYHLGQIPGLVLLFVAATGARRGAGSEVSRAGAPAVGGQVRGASAEGGQVRGASAD